MSDSLPRRPFLSVGFPRQEYWNELPFSSPGDLPNPGIELGSPALQADALPSESPEEAPKYILYLLFFFLNFKIFNSYMRSQT